MKFKNNKYTASMIIWTIGSQFWFENEKPHRLNEPAVIIYNGTRRWFQYDGPAMIYTIGYRVWYQNGKLHRTNGPAVIRNDGSKQWWENGKRIK